MPIEQVTVAGQTASIQFYDPTSDQRRRIRFDHKKMWRGDHRKCSHASGKCVAARGWIVEAGSWKVRPHTVPTSIEERAMGTVSYPGQKGRYPEATQTAKGMVDWSDDLASVKATEEVIRFHIDRHLKELKADLEKQGAKYSEVREALRERREEIEAANGLGKSKPAKGA